MQKFFRIFYIKISTYHSPFKFASHLSKPL